MRLVVTGGAGFIGKTLIALFVARGHDVTVFDRAAAPSQLLGMTNWRRVELTKIDRDDCAVLKDADAVIHLAACPGVRDNRSHIARHRWRDNVEATAVVLESTPLSTPLIAYSSSSIYGGASVQPGGTIRPCQETDPVAPQGGYASSKVVAESLCQQRMGKGGRTLIVRPFTVLGEGQRNDMALSVWARQLQAGAPMEVFGDLRRRRDVTDVVDVARATSDLLDCQAQGVVNIGTGRSHSLDDLIHAVGNALNLAPRVKVTPAQGIEVPHTLANVNRLQEIIGWSPKTDLKDVVKRALINKMPAPRSVTNDLPVGSDHV